MLLYYITDRSEFGGDEPSRRQRLLEKIVEAAECGVDFIQIRERDLSTRKLELLAHDAMRVIRENSPGIVGDDRPATRLLINSRTDIAIACGAAGVHLRSDDVTPGAVREVWKHKLKSVPIVSVACHTEVEVRIAAENGAEYVLFGSVFEKKGWGTSVPPNGLSLLRNACRQKIPVIALGGITLENASSCIYAGAAGVAGIRIFQENKISEVVNRLRS